MEKRNCRTGVHIVKWQPTWRKGNSVEGKKRKCKNYKYKNMQRSGTFLIPLCRGTAVVLDLCCIWGSNSHIALTIPKGMEGVVYTNSAALWSKKGDCLPRKEHSEFPSVVVVVYLPVAQIWPTSRRAGERVGSGCREHWFPTQHFTS